MSDRLCREDHGYEEAQLNKQVQETNPELVQAFISFVDLHESLEHTQQQLAKLKELGKFVVGIRYPTAHSSDFHLWAPAHSMKDSTVQSGVKAIGGAGLVVEIFCFSHQLHEFYNEAKQQPTVRFVLDHCGVPLHYGNSHKRAKVFSHWLEAITKVASLPNVCLKISGLGMACLGFGWHTRKTRPSLDEVVAAWEPIVSNSFKLFGIDRCMIASNFPMDKVSVGFTLCINAFKTIFKDLSREDKIKLFHDNALRIYGLSSPAPVLSGSAGAGVASD
eukprot:TRINITY_DN428_c2_g2_i3.p1 TRINITY_DN428_c2_g2~~TRINITY_DN428_c2_g2_i3.p1  ORF type:complete len:276 (-),score=43.81 TRINITY_DN428_c2_g2_i3:537-1364(-)